MCYSSKQIDNRVRKLAELEAAKKELEKSIAAIKADLQSDMGELEHVTGAKYRVNWTWYESPKFETAKFKAAFPEVAEAWTTTTRARRFSWSAL